MAEAACDLARREAVNVVKEHRLALARRQLGERLADEDEELSRLNGLLGCWLGRQGKHAPADEVVVCAGAPQTHPRQVERDRREPTAEAVRITEARQPEIGLQYRLLRDVLRLVRVREQAQRRRPCAAAMPRDERRECRPLAGTRSEERRVG